MTPPDYPKELLREPANIIQFVLGKHTTWLYSNRRRVAEEIEQALRHYNLLKEYTS